jgi:tetratricopeptide (TPR) repeat protein
VKELGQRLRKLRVEKGLTQRELADPDFTAAYVSTIEAGKRHPSAKAVAHFATKLGVATDELATGRPPDVAVRLHAEFLDGRRALAAGDIEGAIKAFRHLKKKANDFDMPGVEARAEYGLGLCDEASNRLDAAIAHFETAEATFSVEDLPASADALAARGRCLMAIGEVRYAVYLVEKQLDVLRVQGLGDPDALVRLNTSLVAGYFQAGMDDLASRAAKTALDLAQNVDDPERLANMHINVARLLLEQGAWEAAERHYIRAEAFYRQLDYRSDLGRVYLARAYGLRMEGSLDPARVHALDALEIFQETRNETNEARALDQLGRIERATGRNQEARVYLRKALQLTRDGEKVVHGAVQRELALCDSDTDIAAAIRGVKKALVTLSDAEEMKELAVTYRALGDLLLAESQFESACDAFRTAALTLEAAA